MSFAANIGEMILLGRKVLMTKEQSETFINLSFGSNMDPEIIKTMYEGVKQASLALKILDGRLNAIPGYSVKQEDKLGILWLSSMADNPGRAVLMSTVVAFLVQQGRPITITELAMNEFAMGIPSTENLNSAWDAQKYNKRDAELLNITFSSDNLLDYAEAWK